MIRLALIAALLLPLGACREDAPTVPAPVAMSDAALGHYCQMQLAAHPGPKGQIHLQGIEAPLFFAQVRDAIAYLRSPEQEGAIAAAYVSDMGAAASWQEPGAQNWIAAAMAFYVVGSDAVGGMGAAEVVPFARRAQADGFAAAHGGQVMSLADIPDDAVLGPDRRDPAVKDGTDYQKRIQALSKERQN